MKKQAVREHGAQVRRGASGVAVQTARHSANHADGRLAVAVEAFQEVLRTSHLDVSAGGDQEIWNVCQGTSSDSVQVDGYSPFSVRSIVVERSDMDATVRW